MRRFPARRCWSGPVVYCQYKKCFTVRLFVHTIISVEITFDPAKDAINIAKHQGVSLADAAEFERDDAVTWSDQRHEYGEHREIALGYIGDRLFHVVFVYRGEQRRIISLRKANQREVKRYAQT